MSDIRLNPALSYFIKPDDDDGIRVVDGTHEATNLPTYIQAFLADYIARSIQESFPDQEQFVDEVDDPIEQGSGLRTFVPLFNRGVPDELRFTPSIQSQLPETLNRVFPFSATLGQYPPIEDVD